MACDDPWVYVGSVTPEQLVIEIVPSTEGLDMTTVTAVVLSILRGDGTTSSWSTTIVSATAAMLTVKHVYVANDVPAVEKLSVAPLLTVPSGTMHAEPFWLNVLPLKPRIP